jgi:tetratricopeptide (TPR) repeat protein
MTTAPIRYITVLAIFYIFMAIVANTGWCAPVQMSPEAKAAYNLGNLAFDQKDWDQAIRHYAKAQSYDNYNPKILYNLGISHAKAAHELPAIAWLEAYLAVAPSAPEAAQIHAEIARMLVTAESKARRVAKESLAAADPLDSTTADGEWRHYNLQSLSQAYLELGDETKAATLANRAGATFGLSGTAEEQMWWNFALNWRTDDPQAALAATNNITNGKILDSDNVWAEMCEALQSRGKWDTLRQVAQKINDTEKRDHWLQVADNKTKAYSPWNRRDEWVKLAEKLSKNAACIDLESALKDTSDHFWTWTQDKGNRPEDMAWHLTQVSRILSGNLYLIKALQKK